MSASTGNDVEKGRREFYEVLVTYCMFIIWKVIFSRLLDLLQEDKEKEKELKRGHWSRCRSSWVCGLDHRKKRQKLCRIGPGVLR